MQTKMLRVSFIYETDVCVPAMCLARCLVAGAVVANQMDVVLAQEKPIVWWKRHIEQTRRWLEKESSWVLRL